MTRPRVFVLALSLVAMAAASAQDGAEGTKISAVAFGDYYWVASHHRSELEERNGFWFRRIYLTFDQSLGKTLSARLRFEANQAGDFTSNLTLEPFVKDAWLKWRASEHLDVVAGISPTPAWESLEQFWGYRALEKTPLDLYRMGSARDFGIALLGSKGRVRYHFMAGNGSSTGSETNAGKQVALNLGLALTASTVVELYADRDDRAGDTDRTTLQAFAGWRRGGNRIGLQYARQNRDTPAGADVALDVASIFGVHAFREDVSAILRVDRMFDPNPEGDRIPYLPFDTSSKSTLVIAGVDVKLHERFGVIPNVEWVLYDGGAADAGDDVIPRITFYYAF